MRLEPGLAATMACLLEATARKPGNVHRFHDFDDLSYLDFTLSAAAIAEPMARASSRPLGVTILDAVTATRRLVSTNTNLGIILLLAPLAAVDLDTDGSYDHFRSELMRVLSATTVEDARLVYQAIRLASPGGMGQTADQDIAAEPTITLLETMKLAADHDGVARQYATNFHTVFALALPALELAIASNQPLETAIITTYLTILSYCQDTLIQRKRGDSVAIAASAMASEVLDSGWPEQVDALQDFDAWLRQDEHGRNPGTTADLVTAALFVALRTGRLNVLAVRARLGWTAIDL